MNGRGQFPLVRYLVFVTPYLSSCFFVKSLAYFFCILCTSSIQHLFYFYPGSKYYLFSVVFDLELRDVGKLQLDML